MNTSTMTTVTGSALPFTLVIGSCKAIDMGKGMGSTSLSCLSGITGKAVASISGGTLASHTFKHTTMVASIKVSFTGRLRATKRG